MREKVGCKVEGCKNLVTSLGNRGGLPYYTTVCQFHKRARRKQRKLEVKQNNDGNTK